MPRTGPNGEYTLPPNTNNQQSNTTIRSAMFNGFATDVQQALNTEWPSNLLPVVPVDKGGTGGETVAEAQENLQVLSANYALMSIQPNLSVNGSLIDSQENGNTLGTSNGYFYADQHALYKGSLGVSAQRVAHTSLSGGQYAGEFKCTTAKTTLDATDLVTDTEAIEGSRPEFVAAGWGAAGAKQFVHRKEVQKPAGTYSIHVMNSAGNRHCWIPYTVTSDEANQKVVKEIIIPGDTSGVWLKGDGQIGMVIDDVLAAGLTYVGGTAGMWGSTAYYAGSGQKNFLDSISNVARHTDFGTRLDTDATGKYGRYLVGEKDVTFQPLRYFWKPEAFQQRGFIRDGGDVSRFARIDTPLPMCKSPNASCRADWEGQGPASAVIEGSDVYGFRASRNIGSTSGYVNFFDVTANARLS